MHARDTLLLVVLAAIWGGSFLFMRVAAPSFGALPLAEARVALAGIALAAYAVALGRPLPRLADWRAHLVIGAFNSGIPFALFSFAALHIGAAYMAVMNATSPLFGALIGAALGAERIGPGKLAGMALGIAGVALLVGLGPLDVTPWTLAAALASLAAAACYGFAGHYARRSGTGMTPLALALGSQIGAAAVLAPPTAFALPAALPPPEALASVAALALLCTAAAYLAYFRLIVRVGPVRALTVTFLIPVFGLLWGALFLGERITATMIAGCAAVLVATYVALRAEER
ncbi:MAG: DMT family transporter [Burkholderiales bacterium]|nr:DMT family transporter [Burkholderiales bacterium]